MEANSLFSLLAKRPVIQGTFIRRVLLLAILAGMWSVTSLAGTLVHDSILISGVYRQYKLFLPSNYPADGPYPLIINLHARCSNMDEHISYTNMNAIADTANFIVVYPQGLEDPNDPFDCLDWNDNGRHTWDDIAFISELIDRLVKEHFVSSERVYSCGFSRGGALSYTLACELSNKISGIAVVSGGFSISPLINSMDYSCQAVSATPVLVMHGDNDPDINYNGYPNYWPPMDSILAFWEDRNNCLQGFSEMQMPDIITSDNSTVTRFIYNDCPLTFLKIVGGGHSWPGSQGSILIEIPPKNRDVNASLEIWKFFNSIPLTSDMEEPAISRKTTVFPNPFTDRIHLSTTMANCHYVLCGSGGNMIWKGQHVEAMDWGWLPPGNYLLGIAGENTMETLSLIKK